MRCCRPASQPTQPRRGGGSGGRGPPLPPTPLGVGGAESQAQIGSLLAQALRNEFAARGIDRGVACLLTQVVVDAADPAFANPTKPIGPYYQREDEIVVKRAEGWKMMYGQR